MEELRKEIMRKGIITVFQERLERLRLAKENGYILEAALAESDIEVLYLCTVQVQIDIRHLDL